MAEAAAAAGVARRAAPRERTVTVIGVGNALRHDDAVGLEVASVLRARTPCDGEGAIAVHAHAGEPLALLEVWERAHAVVLVDALRSGAAAGTIHRFDASTQPVPAYLRGSFSTHAVGVGETIELARALDRLPERIVVFGVEGARFDAGAGLSPEVDAVLERVAGAVLREARGLREA